MYFFVGLGTVRQSPYSFAHILLQAFTPPDCDLVSICFFSAATEEKLKTKTAAIKINLRENLPHKSPVCESAHASTQMPTRFKCTNRHIAHNRSLLASSDERTAWLPAFLAYYNARRPHSDLDYVPQLPGSVGITYCNSTPSPCRGVWWTQDVLTCNDAETPQLLQT